MHTPSEVIGAEIRIDSEVMSCLKSSWAIEYFQILKNEDMIDLDAIQDCLKDDIISKF